MRRNNYPLLFITYRTAAGAKAYAVGFDVGEEETEYHLVAQLEPVGPEWVVPEPLVIPVDSVIHCRVSPSMRRWEKWV